MKDTGKQNDAVKQYQDTITNLRAELKSVHEELNRTNSELMQLTIALDERVEERTQQLRESEKNLLHINRLLLSIRNINQAIVHEKDCTKLFNQVTEILVEVTGYSFCVIGVRNENSENLTPVACWGLFSCREGTEDMITLNVVCDVDCPAKEAVKKRKTVVINSIKQNRKYPAWKKRTEAHGFESFITVPIQHQKRLFGYISVYSIQKELFKDKTEIGLLEEVANDIGMALFAIEVEKERKESEAALSMSEARYRELLENINDVLFSMSIDGALEYISPGIERITGTTADTLLGNGYHRFIFPDDIDAMLESIRRTSPTDREIIDVRMVREDGEIRYLSASISAIVENGKPKGVTGIITDITQRKRAEEEREEANTRLKTALSSANVGLWDYYPVEQRIYYSDEWKLQLGYKPEDIENKLEEWVTRLHPDDRNRVLTYVSKYIIDGGRDDYLVEFRLRHRDGSYRWMLAEGSAIEFDGKQVRRMLGCHVDITERKRVEDAFKERERLLTFAIDQMPIPVIIATAPDVTITHYNKHVLDMLAFDVSEVSDIPLNRHLEFWPTFYPDGTPYAVEDLPLIRAIKRGETTTNREIIIRQGERERWLSTSATPLYDEAGAIIAGIVVFPEITEIKQAERELQERDELLQSIISTSPTCIFVKDKDGKYVLTNDAIAEVYNTSKNEMLGKTDRDLIPTAVSEPQDIENIIACDKDVIECQEVKFIAEEKLTRLDGEIMWFQTTKIPLQIKGDPNYVLGIAVDITERKRMEAKINEQMMFLQELIDVIPTPVFYKNTEGKYIGCNAAFVDVMGYSKSDIVGKTEYDVAPKELADVFKKTDIELLTRGGVEVYESQLKYADLILRDVLFHKTVFRDMHGEVAGTIGVILDITDLKRTHAALEESERQYRDLVENLNEGIWVIDTQGYTTYVNPSMAWMLGMKPEEILGISIYRFMDDEHAQEVKRHLERRVEGIPEILGLEFIRKDGNKVYVLMNTSPIFNEGGECTGALAAMTDVTDRRVYEEALRESEEKFRNFFETSKDIIYITDIHGTLIDVNPALEDMLGYDREGFIGKSVGPFYLKPDERRQFKVLIERDGFVKDYEVAYKNNTGGIHYCLETATVRRDGAGNIIGYQGFIRDNTERMKMQEQLIQAEKLSSLGGILSGVAHELNNPLTSIIGNAQLLERRPITGEIREKLEVIQRESLRCTKIVGGLLAFAREHKPERVMKDINEVIEEAYNLREYELRVDDVTLITDLDAFIPQTSIDPFQMQQVFINLINNAHHALLDVGGGTLKIVSRSTGKNIIIDFIDNGPGIPEEIKRKIFDPFFTTKETGKGTGLGLSICYGIVNEHGGTIEVESNPGHGTCFSIDLPISSEVSSPIIGLKTSAISKPNGLVSILVIEDEESLRDFVKSALEAEGYVVHTCESANLAVEVLKADKFEAIVSDMKMPGMSGQNFYTYLQKFFPELTNRILFITGDVLGSETQNFFKITGCRYLEKPFEIDDLLMFLGDMLQGSADVH